MATYKNANIADYFKFSSQSCQQKRPFPSGGHEYPRAVRQILPSPTEFRGDGQCNEKAACAGAKHGSTEPTTSPMPSEEARSSRSPSKLPQDDNPLSDLEPVCPGSQTPGFSSSQRIVKNGEVVITNSEEEAGSDTSLDDIDAWLAPRKPYQGHGSIPEPELYYKLPSQNAGDVCGNGAKRRTRGDARCTKKGPPLHNNRPVVPNYRFSLQSLAKQKNQYESSKEGVAQAKSLLQSYEQQELASNARSRISIWKNMIEMNHIVEGIKYDDNGDNLSRLKNAIKRTDALHHSKRWSFFHGTPDESLFEAAEFPSSQDGTFGQSLIEKLFRQQAFLSGYVGECASKRTMPEDILLWIMGALCLESRDDLRYSYAETLKSASKQAASLCLPECINSLFQKIGATNAALDTKKPVVPQAVIAESVETYSRPLLLSVLDVLQGISSHMNAQSRIHVICTLCRLALDFSVVTDCRCASALEEAFRKIIDSIPHENLDHELHIVSVTVFSSISDATLQLQLLHNIPALPPRIILFRQRLALAFYFDDATYLSEGTCNLVDLKSIAQRLQNPQFSVNNDTDYAQLAALVGILSIGIDCGNPPSIIFSKEKAKEAAFNGDIDTLSQKIKSIFTQIVDSGASHMKRTEAKEQLEGLHSRLKYVLRTKPKPKSILLRSSAVEEAGQRKVMKAFVGGEIQNDHLAVPGSASTPRQWDVE